MRGAISETRSATPRLAGDRQDARRRVRPRLVAGAEEVEVKPLVPLRTPLPQLAHRAQQGTEHLEPERQERPDVAEVDRAVGGVEIRVGAGARRRRSKSAGSPPTGMTAHAIVPSSG